MIRKKIPGSGKISAIALLLLVSWFPVSGTYTQTLSQKLQKAFLRFEEDSQLAHAISSLYVIEAATGKVVFDKNSGIGLAPASTQKIITSATAFALLGKDFRYTTTFAAGKQDDILYISPSGDPTLGSERWQNTKADNVLNRISGWMEQNKRPLNNIAIDDSQWAPDYIPDGWIWQDIGNYYGAGCEKLNWRENQFDLLLQSGKNIGDTVLIVGSHPKLYNYHLQSAVLSAARGTGDNAYIYFPLNDTAGYVKGTIPVNEKAYVISGALPSGTRQFISELSDHLAEKGIIKKAPEIKSFTRTGADEHTIVHTETSPGLDSIIYWFNKKSINLYGEALLKTIGYKEKGYGTTDTGVSVVKAFWRQNGINDKEINIVDGSGLSPLNRVTTHAQVQVLQYAQKQEWFSSFIRSLPDYNGMKMKSGTIRNVKGFSGYHTAANGNTYIFSFLVNNYNGSSTALVRKMYTVLDMLK